MYKLNSWTENKKFNNSKIARNYFSTPCGSETTTTACGGEINTACGGETTTTACGGEINTACGGEITSTACGSELY